MEKNIFLFVVNDDNLIILLCDIIINKISLFCMMILEMFILKIEK